MPSKDLSCPPVVLVIGHSDPTGGGGVQGDALTLAAFGCHALPVLSAIGVGDTAHGLFELEILSPRRLLSQAQAVLEDVPVAAFKIGALGSVENCMAVAALVSDYPHAPVVLEAVLWAADEEEEGQEEEEELAAALSELLLPQCQLLVADASQVLRLAGEEEGDPTDPQAVSGCALDLIGSGLGHLLLTGLDGVGPQCVHTLFGSSGVMNTDARGRIPGPQLGAAGVLAAALAGGLAQGRPVLEAVAAGQEHLYRALQSAFRPGMGLSVANRLPPLVVAGVA